MFIRYKNNHQKSHYNFKKGKDERKEENRKQNIYLIDRVSHIVSVNQEAEIDLCESTLKLNAPCQAVELESEFQISTSFSTRSKGDIQSFRERKQSKLMTKTQTQEVAI